MNRLGDWVGFCIASFGKTCGRETARVTRRPSPKAFTERFIQRMFLNVFASKVI